MLLNKDQSRLFVAETMPTAWTSSIDDKHPCRFRRNNHVDRPDTNKSPLPGASPNRLALSPDEKTLYATDGGTIP
jgi:hypothetical protein